MQDFFSDIPLFVEVGRHKSFSRAAEALDMPVSTLSRRIAALEKSLGIPLFLRAARKIEFTESGRRLFERLGPVLAEAEEARDELLDSNAELKGPVRFSAQTDIYLDYLVGVPAAFAARWPGISLHGQYADKWVDLLTEPFDLEIRNSAVPDSTLVARRLASGRSGLYAAPEFLDRFPRPQKPADLAALPSVIIARRGDQWQLSKKGRQEKVIVPAAHTVSGMRMALELCRAGLGVAGLAAFVAGPHERSGEIVRLLPDWSLPGTEINAVLANRKQPRRIRLFVDFLAEHFLRLSRSTE